MGDILVKVRGDGAAFKAATGAPFGATSAEVILSLPASTAPGQLGIAAGAGFSWLRVSAPPLQNPWDAAHALFASGSAFAASGTAGIEAIEPDLEQSWFEPPKDQFALHAVAACTFHGQDSSGGKGTGPDLAWNLRPEYSELLKARGKISDSDLRQVIVAHLDTGYDPKHITLPAHLDLAHQRNFRDKHRPNDATDQTPNGLLAIRNQGHGTATLALLAGNKLSGTSPSWPGFADFIGGAPYASVIPIRIADGVVRFSTSTMVQGFGYAAQMKAHVLTMSMGGLTSRALVDAVNLAYDSGIFMVTAAGNNYAWTLTPGSIVFPARFRRVLAACGLMADGRAYAGLKPGTMQGNYGPTSKMGTALGAYTPNVPWAEFGCGPLVSMDGAGTSAATPQIAAAASLWIAKNWTALQAYSQPWMRVEAVRHALFQAATKRTAMMSPEETLAKIGQGVMQAAKALDIAPQVESALQKLPPAEPSWGWLNLITGIGGVSIAPVISAPQAEMLALELTQMAQRVPEVDAAVSDNDVDAARVPAVARRRYLEAALDKGNPSKPLKSLLEKTLGRAQISAAPAQPPAAAPTPSIARKAKVPPSPPRRLRVYALDPSIAKSISSVSVNETVLSIEWEEKLQPGPVGEYIEVVDVDPASNRLYDPVNLNDPKLLAQDGWTPSEGNPEFHQQMVYAVAMKTIASFEDALGRRSLWAPRYGKVVRRGKDGKDGKDGLKAYEVRRLRIYPHALRTDNAYYSPDKVAVLFGYFQANSRPGDATPTGSMVYSCLSSDIIAHEMSHALLDGMHRRFQEASNLDVPAFHEAFADIVALFQHYSIPELVRFQIARARGVLDAAVLLGSLAKQFGEGIQRGGPLRDYLGPEIDKLSYATTKNVHARGSILVSAVYKAFLAIVNYRTADLVRIATSGSGVLPAGALHPDLVNRLTEETCTTARHVLRMCIRALDYCPAVDITFGEYLRAIITADIELFPADKYHYRVAFMEAFRARDLLPRDVRTVSEETLAWGTLETPRPAWLEQLVEGLDFGLERYVSRSKTFALNEKNRLTMFASLRKIFRTNQALYAQFGLLPGIPRYFANGEIAKEPEPGQTTFEVESVRLSRRVASDGTFPVEVIASIQQRRRVPLNPADPEGPSFWFRGGTTLILDHRQGKREIKYSIVKNSGSETRLERQRQTAAGRTMSPLRSLYFGAEISEPFALLHSHNGGFGHG